MKFTTCLTLLGSALIGSAVFSMTAFGAVHSADSAGSADSADNESSVHTDIIVPCENRDALRRPFFGDTHVHSKHSLDASTQDTRTTPAQAYQFAKGERIGIQPWTAEGKPMRSLQLSRPLDFAAVTDHAELLGEVSICNTPTMEGYSSWQCKIYRNYPRVGYFFFNASAMRMKSRLGFCGEQGELCIQAASGPWQDIQQAAANANDRCEFSTFVAFEWTGIGGTADNWHRNVLFQNDIVPALPVNSVEMPSPFQLWDELDRDCVKADNGCDAVVIPHNSNLSAGTMFRVVDDTGQAINQQQASQMARLETLVEVMQHKGSSECFFGAQGNIAEDELCSFEQLPYNNFSSQLADFLAEPPTADGDFLREVMREGLRQEQRLGVNPFKWGFVGSTDTHLGTPGATDENNFPGHGGAGVPADGEVPKGLPDALEFNPGGLAVLWAEENTRESLFAAMRRREAYGTSGPRMTVRLFGGWEYADDLCAQENFVEQGYQGGVPMGGDLPAATSAIPKFAVRAFRDPGTSEQAGMSLQRIQIIKGWVDAQGQSQEEVYEVAGDANNGATVDTNSCQTSGAGFDQLCSVWKDPAFDADTSAWYYARVVENPTCRWSQQICAANRVNCADSSTITAGLEGCCAFDHQPIIQERAWTSPIWYRAAAGN